MNNFPKLPFELDEKQGDYFLVKYLYKKSNSFDFLRDKSKSSISKLNENAKELTKSSIKFDLKSERNILKELWISVLTDALWCLKSNDTREVPEGRKEALNFFHEDSLGVTELSEIYDAFADFEGIMYGASPERYRDHLAHPFRVWILGHALMDNFEKKWDLDLSGGEALTISETEWKCMWAITSLCHDIGYPVSAMDMVNKKVEKTLRKLGLISSGNIQFSFSHQMLPFHDTNIKLMASKAVNREKQTKNKSENKEKVEKPKNGITYITHLQNKYYLKFIKSFDNLDHGIVSALLISRALVYFLESDYSHDSWSPLDEKDARQFVIRREILRAISSHTCGDIYYQGFNSLSFILYIIDEMQYCGRPTIEEAEKNGIDLAESLIVTEFETNKIDITLKFKGIDKFQDTKQLPYIRRKFEDIKRRFRLAVNTDTTERPELSFYFIKGKYYYRFYMGKDKITFKDQEGRNVNFKEEKEEYKVTIEYLNKKT